MPGAIRLKTGDAGGEDARERTGDAARPTVEFHRAST